MSCVGFGHEKPFGFGQFGITDWAEEALYKTIPRVYREEDDAAQDPKFLRKTVNGYKPPFNELRRFIDRIPAQRDPRECDLNMLDLLGADFEVKPDDFKEDLCRRSSVIHVTQQLLLKGQDQGYKVRGAIDGYIVTVDRLNETECESGVLTVDPPTFIPNMDEVPLDFLGMNVNETIGSGDTTPGPFFGTTLRKSILPSTVTIVSQTSGMTVTDNGAGGLIGDVDGTFTNVIDYTTGTFSFRFNAPTVAGERILITYAFTVPLDVDYTTEFGAWERTEVFFPTAGTTSLTLANSNIRYVHVFRNGRELTQDGPTEAQFSFDGVNTITLHTPSAAGDVYEVKIIDGFKLENTLAPHPRCRSHSLCLTLTLASPTLCPELTPLETFVKRLIAKVKPIHVSFECLVYVITFPTILGVSSVSMSSEILTISMLEEEHLFDLSAADTEPTDTGLKVDME
jgi:hypothetical protein